MNYCLSTLLCLSLLGCTAETEPTSLSVDQLRTEFATASIPAVPDAVLACLLQNWRNELILPVFVCNEEAAMDDTRSDDECFEAEFHGATVSARAQTFAADCEALDCLSDSDGCSRYSGLLTEASLGRAEACLALPCDQVDDCYISEVFCD